MGWFFGAIFFVAGLVPGFDLFTYSTTIGKLGLFLMCVSAVLGITGLILFTFKEFGVHVTTAKEICIHGVPVPNVFITENRPYTWAFITLAQVALLLFIAGLLLELYDNIF